MKSKRKGMSRALVVLMVMSVMFGALAMSGCKKAEPVTPPAPAEKPAEPAKPATPPAAAPIDAEAVLKQQCALCHDVNRIYLSSDQTDWNATVKRMNEEHSKVHPGTDLLSAEQETAIVDFLKSRTISEGEQVVRDKCATCHDLSKITSQAQGSNWQTIVDKMVDSHGADLTEAEQRSAVNFLQGQ